MPPDEVHVDLLPIQRKAYKEMKDDMIAWVEKQAANSTEDEITDPIIAQAAVSRLTRLQQFACAYAQLEDVLVRHRDKATGELVEQWERQVKLSEPSSKLDAVMDVKIIPAVEEGVKLVVFSHFRQLIELLNVRLEKAGIPYATIHGHIPQRERDAQRQRFQEGEAMVCTITRAGGTAIDLFAGERFIFLSRDWSPAINDQAVGRIDRIGQTKAIQVTDIIADHTIEQDKNRTVQLKWSWMRQLLKDDR
jgi:SNF2 family DNA or RNA helicase